jgi:hypothetical protein
MHPSLESRISAWAEMFKGKFMGLLSLVWGAIGFLDLVKAEFLPEKFQTYTVVRAISFLSWKTWLIVSLILLIGVLLEGGHAAIRKKNDELNRTAEEIENIRAETNEILRKSGGPFLALHFLADDLFDEKVRDHYLFIRNMGNRTAFDIEINDLCHTWNGNTYTAKFPRLQLLEPNGAAVPITPEISMNGTKQAVFSMKARISFGALLIGEDAQLMEYQGGEKTLHSVSLNYKDMGIKRCNSATIVASYWGAGVTVSVEDQQ